MYFARKSIWTFKKGQREKGLNKMNEMVSAQARSTKGYKGFLQLLSEQASDYATIITLWETDKARSESSKGLFKEAIKAIEQYTECPPETSNFKLSEAELRI